MVVNCGAWPDAKKGQALKRHLLENLEDDVGNSGSVNYRWHRLKRHGGIGEHIADTTGWFCRV